MFFKIILKWFNSFSNEPTVKDLIRKAERLLLRFESYLPYQETNAGYNNAMRTINTSKSMLLEMQGMKESDQRHFLKKLIKHLKKMNKLKYC